MAEWSARRVNKATGVTGRCRKRGSSRPHSPPSSALLLFNLIALLAGLEEHLVAQTSCEKLRSPVARRVEASARSVMRADTRATAPHSCLVFVNWPTTFATSSLSRRRRQAGGLNLVAKCSCVLLGTPGLLLLAALHRFAAVRVALHGEHSALDKGPMEAYSRST